jgi:integrase
MNAADPFSSVVGPFAADYLAHMRAIGRSYKNEEHILRNLDAFLTTINSDFTSGSFSAWCQTQGHLTSGVFRRRLLILRNMCLYRRRNDPACFVPDIAHFPAYHQPIRPYIFTEPEIVRLLEATDTLHPTSNSPLSREVYRLAIALFYTCGLRLRELVRLTVNDYEPREHTILVRESKFHKSRLLPLSSDGFRELDMYLEIRRAKRLPMSPESPLLWNRHGEGNGYAGVSVFQVIRGLYRNTGIRTHDGSLPRVHDLRYVLSFIMFSVFLPSL